MPAVAVLGPGQSGKTTLCPAAFPNHRLAAGRRGQELNLLALGGDAGVSHNTARSWLSVLEASFVLFQVPPWVRNRRKRVIKAPKLHFLDSGLACHLLGIREPGELVSHPLRGAILEGWVASEVLKWRVHRGLSAGLFHLRETRGSEVDLLVESGPSLLAVEARSGRTLGSDFLDGLIELGERTQVSHRDLLVQPRLIEGIALATVRRANDRGGPLPAQPEGGRGGCGPGSSLGRFTDATASLSATRLDQDR